MYDSDYITLIKSKTAGTVKRTVVAKGGQAGLNRRSTEAFRAVKNVSSHHNDENMSLCIFPTPSGVKKIAYIVVFW